HRPGIPAEAAWPEHANYVYQRQGLACLVCGRETIVVEEMAARKLYRCLTCQS
ncbi:Fpg/Nei family DNA glycosylase, partial [Aquicoccus sp. SCR17]|nr:Fpg/Nei family DNA glycosylase [Carideicomes alvinocaridis]